MGSTVYPKFAKVWRMSRLRPNFTVTVHTDILARAIGRVASEPIDEPFHGRSFGRQRFTSQTAAVVVSDEHVAGFAIDTNKVMLALGVLAALGHESEINRQTLITDSGAHGGLGPSGLLSEFGGNANGTAGPQLGREGEGRHAFDETMQSGEPPKVEVSKTLMPKHP